MPAFAGMTTGIYSYLLSFYTLNPKPYTLVFACNLFKMLGKKQDTGAGAVDSASLHTDLCLAVMIFER